MKKLNLKKIITIGLITTSILAVVPVGVNAEWMKQENAIGTGFGWWYKEGSSWATGWRQINSKWYYFNKLGYMNADAFIEDQSGYVYYLDSNGAMQTGTIKVKGVTIELDNQGRWIPSVKNPNPFPTAVAEKMLIEKGLKNSLGVGSVVHVNGLKGYCYPNYSTGGNGSAYDELILLQDGTAINYTNGQKPDPSYFEKEKGKWTNINEKWHFEYNDGSKAQGLIIDNQGGITLVDDQGYKVA